MRLPRGKRRRRNRRWFEVGSTVDWVYSSRDTDRSIPADLSGRAGVDRAKSPMPRVQPNSGPPSELYILYRITVMTGPCQPSNGLFIRAVRVIITRLVGTGRRELSRPLMTEFLSNTLRLLRPLQTPRKNTHLLLLLPLFFLFPTAAAAYNLHIDTGIH